MQKTGKGKALAIFVDEDDRWRSKSLYSAIVERARAEGLAGATVTRGIMGFGACSCLNRAARLKLSEDNPIVVTIVDSPDRIDQFLPSVAEMVDEGLVATWDVNIELYRTGSAPAAAVVAGS